MDFNLLSKWLNNTVSSFLIVLVSNCPGDGFGGPGGGFGGPGGGLLNLSSSSGLPLLLLPFKPPQGPPKPPPGPPKPPGLHKTLSLANARLFVFRAH